MKKVSLRFPMKRYEKIAGWLYVPVHIFLLAFGVAWMCDYLLPLVHLEAATAWRNFIYYAVTTVFVMTVLFSFMRANFHALCDNFWVSLRNVLFGYIFYYAMMYALSMALSLVLTELDNPNTINVITQTKFNPNVMLVVGVILAPIAEEALFRGVVFGTLHQKSRVLAYIVSALLFSVYHLWDYLLGGFDWNILLYMVQYVPGAIALGWCYEKSGNLWSPIVLHAVINYISINVTFG